MTPQLALFADAPSPDDPLPLLVANRWGFPLQYHNIDEVLWYSVQDWLRGITGQEDIKTVWAMLKKHTFNSVEPMKQLPYVRSNSKTYQMDFTTDKGLYLITQHLRSMESRPALDAIKGYLAEAGAFLDEMRRSPEKALEVAAKAHAAQEQRYLQAGHSQEWVEARFQGVQSRRAFTDAIKRAVVEAQAALYGQATNQVYQGLFGLNSQELRKEMGLPAKANPRDHLHLVGIQYVGLVEAVVSTKLAQYGPDDPIPPAVAIQLIRTIAEQIGLNAQQMGAMLGLDIITGRPLLGGGA